MNPDNSELPKSTYQCYHCKQWIEKGEAHDCWTTTEAALTADLSDDLRDAWERLRETAVEFGEQRVYASHHSIMFSRKACYFFVRPKKTFLEVCVFLDRPIHAPNVRRVERPSRTKVANVIRITHRDEVEAPFTDWLREAYELPDKGARFASPSHSRRSNVAKKAAGTRKKTTGGSRKTGGRKTARKSSAKRTQVKNRAGSFYAKRKTSGRFSEMDEKGRSLSTDRRRKAKKTTKAGYGDQGDRRRTSSKKR